jgi:Tfp pilus assembly protein PilF
MDDMDYWDEFDDDEFGDGDMDELEGNMYYVHAAKYFDDGDYSGAISECSTAISKGVEDARIYNIRAHSYVQIGEYLKARLDYEASFRLDPSDSWVGDKCDELRSMGF